MRRKGSLTGRAGDSLRALSRGEWSISEQPSALDLLQEAELRDWVNRLVASLTRCQRALILLRYWSDQPWGEIAATLKTTEKACVMKHKRAIERLRARAEKQGVSELRQLL